MTAADVPPFTITVHDDGETATMAIAGGWDAATAPTVAPYLDAVVARLPRAIVADLSHVTFLASAGITQLLRLTEQARAAAIPSSVVASARAVLRPLELIGIASALVIHPTLDDARIWVGELP